MRGLLIRLRYLGECDIIVEHKKLDYLLYHAVLDFADRIILGKA